MRGSVLLALGAAAAAAATATRAARADGGAAAAPATPAADPDAWLASLTDRVVGDLAAGRPLVVQVHVPLCDRDIIPCGNRRLGDGDAPATNLYWATTEGFAGWFGRRGSGWKQVLRGGGDAAGDRDVLEVRVWTCAVAAPRAWRRRGAPARFPIYVVAFAWRGAAIDRALAAYWDDLYGTGARAITLADGTRLAAGGGAQLVAYVGHNRLYDVDPPDWPALVRAGAPVRGTFAIACNTGPFMGDHVPAATRVPLLYTRDFLMASAPALEGALRAFAAGGDYRAIRLGGAAGYARGGGRDLRRVEGAFTNPGDRRWGRW